MVAGIPPREASDRLGIFQARFDELWRKYETYSGKGTGTKSCFYSLVILYCKIRGCLTTHWNTFPMSSHFSLQVERSCLA